MATAAGYKAALVMARPTDIINAIIAALIHARYELPACSTLERIQGGAHALAHRNICKSVFRKLRSKERKALDRLLVIAVDQAATAAALAQASGEEYSAFGMVGNARQRGHRTERCCPVAGG